MISRFASRCAVCGQAIAVGAEITRHATLGRYVHAACAAAPAPAATVAEDRTPRAAVTAAEVWAAFALPIVAGMDGDRATVRNGVGFSRYDGEAGHDIAGFIVRRGTLSPRQWNLAVKLARKYQRQVPVPPPAADATVEAVKAAIDADANRAEMDSADRAEMEMARRERNAMDAEYNAGVQDARNYQENRRWFGQEAADAMEIEREMRFGDGY